MEQLTNAERRLLELSCRPRESVNRRARLSRVGTGVALVGAAAWAGLVVWRWSNGEIGDVEFLDVLGVLLLVVGNLVTIWGTARELCTARALIAKLQRRSLCPPNDG